MEHFILIAAYLIWLYLMVDKLTKDEKKNKSIVELIHAGLWALAISEFLMFLSHVF